MPDALRGMVLAAGYGTRLAPLTDHVPKPLLPVDGRTLLDRALDACFAAGCARVAVNTHHLGGQIADHVARRADAARIALHPEPAILGTGGALWGARAFLSGAPLILLHNGDVLGDADLAALVAEHRRTGARATLLLADWPAVNTVRLAADGRVASIAGRPGPPPAGADARALTYTGLAVLSSSLLADLPAGPSSLVDLLAAALARDPASVRGWAPEIAWSDLGTLGRYLAAQGAASTAPAAADGAGATPATLRPLTGHGSDRRFWRLAAGGWSAVAMADPAGDDEFSRFVAVSRFLHARELGAARLLLVDEAQPAALMEDLGDLSLERLARDEGPAAPAVAAAYTAAVDRLLDLQATTPAAAAACPVAVDRALDAAALRWETDYFRAEFLRRACGLPEDALAGLDDEFAALAATVAAQPRQLLHRDYQSQNLMVTGAAVRPVDVQGMRLGPVGYDLASLVWDPYVALPDALRRSLVARFADGALARGLAPGATTPDEIAAMVTAAAAQRLMQALGAYGRLGLAKGKPVFLRHIPRGVAHLRLVLAAAADPGVPAAARRRLPPPMPRLAALVAGLDTARWASDPGHSPLDAGPTAR